jgi:transcriptional regulator with XRE-family HTH domain
MASLAATVGRVTELADKVGRPPEEVLNSEALHLDCGVPVDVIDALLQGRAAGEESIQLRFLQRLQMLQRTQLREDGRKYTQVDIAKGTGISRQQINALCNGERRPTMDHVALIEQFFNRDAGWLQSGDAAALNTALLRREKALLQEYADFETSNQDGSPNLFSRLGVENIALRAALLPDDRSRAKVVRWLDHLLEEESERKNQ